MDVLYISFLFGVVVYYSIQFLRKNDPLNLYFLALCLSLGAAVLCAARDAERWLPAGIFVHLEAFGPYANDLAALALIGFTRRFLGVLPGRFPRLAPYLLSCAVALVSLFAVAPLMRPATFAILNNLIFLSAISFLTVTVVYVAWRSPIHAWLYALGHCLLVFAVGLYALGLPYDFRGGVMAFLALAMLGQEMRRRRQNGARRDDPPPSEPPAPRAVGINPEQVLRRLEVLMEVDQLYCDEDLSLSRLAHELDIRPDQLSYVLNQLCRKNFAQFVNGYRIELAQRLLLEEGGRSIASIAQSVGFNSQQVFNAVFRKYASMSPGQYRKRERAQAKTPETL